MSIPIQIEKIVEQDLLELVKEQEPESETLEFKRDVVFKPEPALTEFLKDITAFANADGGDLIIGMDEDDQGRAKELRSTQHTDLQELEKKIIAYCTKHISPPLVGIKIRTVKIPRGSAFLELCLSSISCR